MNIGGFLLLTKNNDEVLFFLSDDLILWDEVFWDVWLVNDKLIWWFDCYLEVVGVCFYLGGNEIIIGWEVWDIRLLRLFRVVFLFDRVALKFNFIGIVGMVYILYFRNELLFLFLCKCYYLYKYFFCIIDMFDYLDICIVDVFSGMIDVVWDVNFDIFCVMVEYDILNIYELIVCLYEVGRLWLVDDELDVEDEYEEIEFMVLNMDYDGWEEDYLDEDLEECIEDVDGWVNINEVCIWY